MFDARRRDESGRHEISCAWSTATQWVLDEHRTQDGRALLPGTAYVELARAALAEIREAQEFEIRDLLFFVPLFVDDDAIRQVRVRLTPDEQGYRFEVQSHVRLDASAGGWQTHAQASLRLRAPKAGAAVDLAAVDARCTGRRVPYAKDGLASIQAGRLRFGPRWQQALRQVAFGAGEALAVVELGGAAAIDCEAFGLHPTLLDIATGYALELLGPQAVQALWVPVSYERILVFGRLPAKVLSWVRLRTGTSHDDIASFDVALVDAVGTVLVEVQRFSVRRTADGDALRQGQERTMADLELDAATADHRPSSPAETALRHNVSQGILPAEGWAAFARVLGSDLGPQVVVSSMDLGQLEAQAQAIARRDDHSDTKFERPALDSDFVAPRDDIERSLCTFWEELLGVDGIGVRDSFFDLGGHSLIAVRLFARIRKAFDVDYPISLLFEAPTIEQCAARIRESIGHDDTAQSARSEPRARYTHLVAMHPDRDAGRTPFFLIAGMFGNVLNLRHLANLIGTDRPFYGLQARGLYGDLEPHESFEEMARDYIAELRSVQPRGPYLLGGFSGGGLTAYEIAQQLCAGGEEVALLVLLDSILPQPPQLTGTDKLRIHLQEFRRQGLAYFGRRLRNRVRWEIEKRQRQRDPDAAPRPRTEFRSEKIEAAFRRACDRYRLRAYPGRVVLFRPPIDACYVLGPGRVANKKRQLVVPDNGWTPWVGSLEIQEVPGDHDSMVLDPNVRVLAARLQQHIEAAEARLQAAATAAVRRRG
jgi:thioesterase domain-containing protein